MWYLQPIFDSFLLVAGLALALVLLMLVPMFRTLSGPRRWMILGLRCATILLLMLTMLRPTHISTSSKRQSAMLLVLLDKSRSMQLPNATGGLSRWEAQQDVLRKAEPLLKDLAEDLEIKVHAYDQQLHSVAFENGRLALPAAADGEQTDIGSTLYEAVLREHGKRLAGVILLGDGAQTAFEPKVEIGEAARELGRLGYPLYAVGFGPAADAAQSRDIAVEQLPEQYTVFVKNELQVRGLLRVRGYVNQDIPVEMIVQKPDGTEEVFGPLSLQARQDGEQVPIEMSFVPDEPGDYRLTLRAAEQPGELVAKNNELREFLTVLEGGLKVLYLEGEHRDETRFLRRTLDASPDMQVSFDLFESAGRGKWPINVGNVFKEDAFDVIILGDLDAEALGTENLGDLAAAVERGKGLLTLGGLHSYGAGGYRGTPLEAVLPIVMGRFERQDFDGVFRADLHLTGKLRLLPARPHPVMQLATPAGNAAAWQRLPPLRGANKFADIKQSPGVQVIGQTDDGVPLVVASEYGRGRVLSLAFDSTWLWAMRGFDESHRRFWRQSILWLVRRDDLQREDVWIQLAQRRFRLGSDVSFETGLKSQPDAWPDDVQLTATMKLPDGTLQPVPLSTEEDHFRGTFDSTPTAGDYLVEVAATQQGRTLGTARAAFQVLDEDVELSNPAADLDQLARLTAMTREFGGRLLAAEQLPPLLREIKRKPPELDIQVQTKWQLPGSAGSSWMVFLAFVGLLLAEWLVRKKSGLV